MEKNSDLTIAKTELENSDHGEPTTPVEPELHAPAALDAQELPPAVPDAVAPIAVNTAANNVVENRNPRPVTANIAIVPINHVAQLIAQFDVVLPREEPERESHVSKLIAKFNSGKIDNK